MLKKRLLTTPTERGFEPHIFSNFPAHDLNFHGREGDEIKSNQASKRDRTLLTLIRCLISGQTTARCGLTEMRRGKRKSAEKTSVNDPDGP